MNADRAELIEVFRKALLAEHANDWDMETCAEAAHICARAVPTETDDDEPIRLDERQKIAALLTEHAVTLGEFTDDGVQAVRLVAYIIGLHGAAAGVVPGSDT